ncbi:DUF3383 family protein [Veillonella magna]|uniref:DUF3383 family protein n=1 Tax=Veillonella magna TaxID=464322 RepID=UPI002666EB26|nr:DUF3383 family protein [Veillonella magna]
MPVAPLPISDIVRVVVNLSNPAAVRKSFDLALLVCENNVIPKDERVRLFSSLTEMSQAGFKVEDRVYKAAQLLFGQSRKPPRVLIGTKDSAETALQAIQACREKNMDWFVVTVCEDLEVDDHVAIAEYINSVTPDTIYAYTSKEDNDLAATDESVGIKLKNKNIRMAFGQYSSKHKDAVVAAMGYAMGSMTGLADTAYTLAYKQQSGVETENSTGVFSSQHLQNLINSRMNVYINRGGQYDGLEQGRMADGTWFDEIHYLAKMKNDIQLNIMDLLYSSDKVEGEESGMTKIHSKIVEVCEDFRRIGFIAKDGVWNKDPILNLKTGDTLPRGYLVQSEPIAGQAQADRDNRIAPPFYVSVKLSGALQQVTIEVDVNR